LVVEAVTYMAIQHAIAGPARSSAGDSAACYQNFPGNWAMIPLLKVSAIRGDGCCIAGYRSLLTDIIVYDRGGRAI
jgi:hypothetical protein